MTDAEFKDYFVVLDKAGDRARSVLYVFIVFNLAVSLYALSSFAYPAQQFAFDDLRLQAKCVAQTSDIKCRDVHAKLMAANAPPPLDPAIASTLRVHELQQAYDRSVAARTFRAPVLGLETDRDVIWLILPLAGVIGYYIVWSTFGRLVEMFGFLLSRNRSDPVRLRLILFSLVITAPLNFVGNDMSWRHCSLWQATATLVFAIPLIVVVLMIADQTNITATYFWRIESAYFMPEPTFWLKLKVVGECVALALLFALFRKLMELASRFGQYQAEAVSFVTRLEGVENAPD